MTDKPARAAAYNAYYEAGLNRYEANLLLNNHHHEVITPALQIVVAYVTESNDNGGIDANDLADRLRAAGYILPGDLDGEVDDL